MKDDIVERLDEDAEGAEFFGEWDTVSLLRDAILEIKRLRHEVERLNARTLARPWGD